MKEKWPKNTLQGTQLKVIFCLNKHSLKVFLIDILLMIYLWIIKEKVIIICFVNYTATNFFVTGTCSFNNIFPKRNCSTYSDS